MTQGQKSYNEQRIIRISDENVEGQCINNMASVRPSLSPLKPNRFFYRPSIVASSSQSYNSSMWGRDLRMEESGRFGLRAASSASESISGIIRRKWRQEHNLRERDRRREESIMYELIRTCLSDKDIHLYLPGVNKTPENLSYHQILTISSKIVENEMREMALFNRHKELVRALEAECIKRGIALPEDRPHITCPMEKHRRYAKIVNEALRMDRCRMHLNANGAGEGPPTSREVALQIDKKLRESDRPPVRGSKKRSGDHYDRSSKRHHPSSLPCREVTSEENGFPFTNREPPHGTKDTPDIQILPQSTSVDTIPLSPRLNLFSSHASATQHLDPQSQEDLKNEEFLDVPALDDVFDLPLLSPSTGVNLGIETEPLFYLLSSTELDVHPVDI